MIHSSTKFHLAKWNRLRGLNFLKVMSRVITVVLFNGKAWKLLSCPVFLGISCWDFFFCVALLTIHMPTTFYVVKWPWLQGLNFQKVMSWDITPLLFYGKSSNSADTYTTWKTSCAFSGLASWEFFFVALLIVAMSTKFHIAKWNSFQRLDFETRNELTYCSSSVFNDESSKTKFLTRRADFVFLLRNLAS